MLKAGKSPLTDDVLYDRKRRAMIREAARAFAKHGFSNTSMGDIAATMGLTKAALYYYFKDKSHLLYECHLLTMQMAEETIDDAKRAHSEGAAALLAFIRLYTEAITKELGSAGIFVEVYALEGRYRESILSRRDHLQAELIQIVKTGVQDGSIRPLDPQVTVYLIMGAVNWIPAWFKPEGRMSGHDVAQCLETLIAEGIRA